MIDLEQHRPGPHEEEVGDRRAVHGHHGVGRGERGVDDGERRLASEVHDVRREPGAAAGGDDVRQVEDRS